jgi:signal transduction histidine kinase
MTVDWTSLLQFLRFPLRKALRFPPGEALRRRFQNPLTPSITEGVLPLAPFLTWRHRFLQRRSRVLSAVVLFLVVGISALNVAIVIPMMNASGDPKLAFGPQQWADYLQVMTVEVAAVSVCVMLPYMRYFRQRPDLVMLLLAWGLMLLPQMMVAFRGEALFDADVWILFYAIQALLVPVHWRLHLLSQTVVIGFFGSAFALGLRDPDVLVQAGYFIGLVYGLIICTIADLGVFLYEGQLRREFELRQQLQVFTHAVSHDLRNPVLGLAMVLKSLANPAGETVPLPRPVLEQMIASSDRQLQFIDSLLEVHSTELHGLALHRQPMALRDLVESVLADFQPFFAQHRASVQVNLPLDLPPVDIDPLQVRRVYENLLSNALSYNPAGLTLTLGAAVIQPVPERRGDVLNPQWLRCTVHNDGAEMTAEQCDRIFDLYTRGPNRRQTLSLGLGLYICRQIVTAHGGTIGVVSPPVRGSRFGLRCPGLSPSLDPVPVYRGL